VVLKLFAAIGNPRLIHCFDVGHFNVFSRIPLEKWLSRIASGGRIHFHFHDNRGDNDSHLPVGAGNVDWYRLKKIIPALFRDFTVTLESHTRKDLEKSLRFYRKIFILEP
jgi:sugar phosphate isomerase/epimerase